jgi:hypothetical protein
MEHAKVQPRAGAHGRPARRGDGLAALGPLCRGALLGHRREDYSENGNAWAYFPHDHARSRAYRWGEDGLAAICDRYQLLCFAMALWNERDPILKERLFGVVPSEGNHGEDVKEYYFYLDSTPSHSYMKWLYKYPQREYPYQRLVEENQRRGGRGPEFELLDTGLFDDDRYFDVFVEYAKVTPEDMAVRVTIHNRGPEPAPIQVLPHLWFRNTWAWGPRTLAEPSIVIEEMGPGRDVLLADDSSADPLSNLPFLYRLGPRRLTVPAGGEPLFTNNETHMQRLYGAEAQSRTPYVKDAFHRYVVNGEKGAVDPARKGTKACVRFRAVVPPGGSVVYRFRFTGDEPTPDPLGEVDAIVDCRKAEADAFYEEVHPARATADEKNVQRQAFAGMLWSKQIYLFDVNQWFEGDNPGFPPPRSRVSIRNTHWRHLNSMRILSMPDKWEYPVVRGLGPRLPLHAARPRRPGVRQGAALAAALRAVPAPVRAAARLRVGVLGPEPARARLGGLARLQHGPHPQRQGRSRVPGEVLPQAADQLRLVDQQGRPLRATTSSRAASWASTTSRSSTAASPCPRAPCSSSPTPRAGWACSA